MKLPRDSASPASLNLMRDCPRCFWLELVQGIKRPRGPVYSLPSRFDIMIKEYCKPYRGGSNLPPLLSGAGIAGRLVDPSLKSWTEPKTGLRVTGRLDECLQNPEGDCAPLDHKTRGRPAESAHPTYQVQLDIYRLLLQGNGYPVSCQGILVNYTYGESDLDRGILLSVTPITLSTDPGAALDLVNLAADILGQEGPRAPSQSCPYCWWVAKAGRWAVGVD